MCYGITGFWKMHWHGKYVAWWIGLNRKITLPCSSVLPPGLEGRSMTYRAKSFLYEHWMSNSFTPSSLRYWNFVCNCLINNSSVLLCSPAHAFDPFQENGECVLSTYSCGQISSSTLSRIRPVLLQRRNSWWYLWLEKTNVIHPAMNEQTQLMTQNKASGFKDLS